MSAVAVAAEAELFVPEWKPIPVYTIFYRRHDIGSYTDGFVAMSKVDPDDPNFRVWVRVEDKVWLVWPNLDEKEEAA